MPSNSGWVTSFGGKIIIDANEGTLDTAGNRSQITVVASLYNGNANQAGPNSGVLSSNMTGSDPPGDSLAWVGPDWQVNTVAPGATKTIFTHTVWAAHDSSGGGTATVGWNYNLKSGTATAIFGSHGSISVNVPLSQLAGAPDVPSNLVASNVLPTSLTLSWDPVDGASYYEVIGDQGDSITTESITAFPTGTTYNFTGLAAGKNYTFEVLARNGAGWSQPSSPLTVQTLAGAWIRVDGVWKQSIPYVRDLGVWKMALPYVREAGVWKQTH